jgi:glycosyltransferase 2 family protein
VSALAIIGLASIIDLRATIETLGRTDLRWLAATLLMVPFQVLLRTARWRLLLPHRPDGERPSIQRVMPVLLAGYFGNLVLPARLGEPVRAYLAARREQLSFPRVLGSVLLERVIDLATLALVAFAAAWAAGAPTWMVRGTAIVALIGFGLAVVLLTSGIPRVLRTVTRVLGARIERVRGAIRVLVTFGEGAGGQGRGPLAAALGISTVTWAFVAGTYWLLGQALGLDLALAGALLIAAIATLGTAIPSAPAHIGTFEVAAVVGATAIGVAPDQALALALLAHAVTILPFAIAGAGTVAWMSISLRSIASEAAAALPEPNRAG